MAANRSDNLERDLLIVEATIRDLKDHLLGDSIYWELRRPSAGGYSLPKGTLGGLLMRLHRLNALRDDLTPAQAERLDTATTTAEETLHRWDVQAREMASRETSARLGLWQNYVAELADNPRRYTPEYATQAEGRTALSMLLTFSGDSGREALAQIGSVDAMLKAVPAEEGFVWDDELSAAYPQHEFWWLYLRPLPEKTEED